MNEQAALASDRTDGIALEVVQPFAARGVIVCGSTRRGSYNRALAAIAVELGPEVGLQLEPLAIDGLPLYNGDLEAATDGLGPAEVRELRTRVDAVDLLVIATPEYNGSVPPLLKNAIDWLSRPEDESVLSGKLVALMGASPSAEGTANAQRHLREILARIGAVTLESPRVMIGRAHMRFEGLRLPADDRERVRGLLIATRLAHERHTALLQLCR
jgi:chromate reductase